MAKKSIPNETTDRLFSYIRALMCLRKEGIETVSSSRLAAICHVSPAIVRKDFSYFGGFGTRGVGYDVRNLIGNIRKILGFDKGVKIALVGVGNIGKALLSHSSFQLEGFQIAMAFDNDPAKIGVEIGSVTVEDMTHLESRVASEGIGLAIVAVPDTAAARIAQLLAAGGVRSILSFVPCELAMPDNVKVTCVDLSMEMARLVYYSYSHEEAGSGQAV